MKLEKQVCSLELAKKLKELGVPQFNSYFAWTEVAQKEKDNLGRPLWKYQVVKNDFQADIEFISAFTVAELGEILKNWVYEIRGQGIWIITAINPPSLDKNGKPTYQTHSANTEADCRAKMLIYLLENKLI